MITVDHRATIQANDDVIGTVQITVEADTHHLAIEDLHRLLAAMESFTVDAAVGKTTGQAVASM